MTTNGIEKTEILLCFKKNGENLLGVTDDKVLLSFIAQYVKFIQINEDKIKTIPVAEIIKKINKGGLIMEIRYWRYERCGKESYDSEDFYTISKKKV